MIESGGPDFTTIGMGVGGVALGVWGIYEKFMRYKLEKAQIANQTVQENANNALFSNLTMRLHSLEEKVTKLEIDLHREREYRFLLITTMIEQGLSPPPFPST
jgi:hypothetical protein